MKEGRIAILEKVPFGGVDQHVFIHGENSYKPVLLMVHGGIEIVSSALGKIEIQKRIRIGYDELLKQNWKSIISVLKGETQE